MFKFVSGSEYDGNWSNGKQDGYGALYDRSGFVILKGEWKLGTFIC